MVANEQEPFLTLEEFSKICQTEPQYVVEMVEMGILEPEGESVRLWHFSIWHIHRFRKAIRLQADLKLNLPGVALSLDLIEELKLLREHVNSLEHQLKLFSKNY